MSLPPSEIPLGAMRFNSDSQKLEYWDGSQWVQVHTFSPNLNGGARGLRAGGQTPGITDTIDYVTISSTGNAQDFGNLSSSRFGCGGIGSSTRGIFAGGGTPTRLNIIEYIIIASTGDVQDFGDLTKQVAIPASTTGNATRGLTFGGATSSGTTNIIDYITIASIGDAKDFGDIQNSKNGNAAVSSPVRAVSAGGDLLANGTHINTIDFITIATLGDAQDFGDLSAAGTGSGVSSPVRGVFQISAGSAITNLDFITISTLGNSQKFGDLSNPALNVAGSFCSSIRGIFAGIRTPTITNIIEYVTIQTQGNGIDFGDLTQTVQNGGGLSNAHGGL